MSVSSSSPNRLADPGQIQRRSPAETKRVEPHRMHPTAPRGRREGLYCRSQSGSRGEQPAGHRLSCMTAYFIFALECQTSSEDGERSDRVAAPSVRRKRAPPTSFSELKLSTSEHRQTHGFGCASPKPCMQSCNSLERHCEASRRRASSACILD